VPAVNPQRLAPKRLDRGVSLIEVLVVIVLIAFGLIGVVGLQARAVQNSVSTEDTVRASLLADEIISLIYMRGSDPLSITAADVTAWQGRLDDLQDRGLPQGEGDFEVANPSPGTFLVTVRVRWTPTSSTTGQRRYETQVTFP
jgi:type IV pilus assembly protein PilV